MSDFSRQVEGGNLVSSGFCPAYRFSLLPMRCGKNGLPVRNAGYSMVEILVIIAVIGILSGLGIFAVTGMVQTSKIEAAKVNLEHINQAVRRYNHAVKELTTNEIAVDSSSTADEQEVFDELQIDGSVNARPGSPYLETNLKVRASSDTTTYRAFWNGYEFQLIESGASGTGLDLMRLQ